MLAVGIGASRAPRDVGQDDEVGGERPEQELVAGPAQVVVHAKQLAVEAAAFRDGLAGAIGASEEGVRRHLMLRGRSGSRCVDSIPWSRWRDGAPRQRWLHVSVPNQLLLIHGFRIMRAGGMPGAQPAGVLEG